MTSLINFIFLLAKRLIRLVWIMAFAVLMLCLLAFIAVLGLLTWLVYRISGRKLPASPFVRFAQTTAAWRAGSWSNSEAGSRQTSTADDVIDVVDVVDVQARELDTPTKHLH